MRLKRFLVIYLVELFQEIFLLRLCILLNTRGLTIIWALNKVQTIANNGLRIDLGGLKKDLNEWVQILPK